MNIFKKLKTFLGLSIGTRRSGLMEKTGGEKSSGTVPLKEQSHEMLKVIFKYGLIGLGLERNC
jgi:hypothetical protein